MMNKILIVDGEPHNLDVLENCLHEAGFEVMTANSGKAALRRVAHIRPDITLLDVKMPGMDGFETCRRLKMTDTAKDELFRFCQNPSGIRKEPISNIPVAISIFSRFGSSFWKARSNVLSLRLSMIMGSFFAIFIFSRPVSVIKSGQKHGGSVPSAFYVFTTINGHHGADHCCHQFLLVFYMGEQLTFCYGDISAGFSDFSDSPESLSFGRRQEIHFEFNTQNSGILRHQRESRITTGSIKHS